MSSTSDISNHFPGATLPFDSEIVPRHTGSVSPATSVAPSPGAAASILPPGGPGPSLPPHGDGSIPALQPPAVELSPADMALLVTTLMQKVSDAQSTFEQQNLKVDNQEKQEAYKTSNEKIENSVKSLQKARKKQKALGILGTIGKVFASIAAVALSVATGGAATPLAVALIAYTIVDTTLTVADAISQGVGGPRLDLNDLLDEGITKAAEGFGADKQKAEEIGKWSAFGIQIAVAVVTVAYSAYNLKNAVTTAKNMASAAPGAVTRAIKITGTASQAISGATTATAGGLSISVGVDNYDSQQAMREKERMDATVAALSEAIGNTLDRLQQIASVLSSSVSDTARIVATIGRTGIEVAAAGNGNAMV